MTRVNVLIVLLLTFFAMRSEAQWGYMPPYYGYGGYGYGYPYYGYGGFPRYGRGGECNFRSTCDIYIDIVFSALNWYILIKTYSVCIQDGQALLKEH